MVVMVVAMTTDLSNGYLLVVAVKTDLSNGCDGSSCDNRPQSYCDGGSCGTFKTVPASL